MKTFQPKEKEVKREWHLVDAKDEVLGRLSTKVANLLTGKNKVSYSSHMDSGDYVVVINAEKVVVTGKKASQKVYRTHSGYPGGFKERSYSQMMEEHPERIVEHSVSGMIPDNKIKAQRMARLTVVAGPVNPLESKFANGKN